MSLLRGQKMTYPNYTDIAEEYGLLVPCWANLEGFATDAIIRDAMWRFTEFRSFWNNQGEMIHFIRNYVETVESMPLYTPEPKEVTSEQGWTIWGTTLRMLEI